MLRVIIPFKSIPKIWDKERLGKKPNTMRKIDNKDARFLLLNYIKECSINQESEFWVKMKNTKTKKSFLRKIIDVTEFDGYDIISWDKEARCISWD